MRRTCRILCSVLILLASSLGALAQNAAQTPDFYALRKDSSYESGCFGPCECPIVTQGPVRGGFRLTFTGFDGLYDNYFVDQVKWKVPQSSGDLRVTGSGTYRIGGEFARQHQLSLDLQVGSDPIQHYDSGLVTPTTDYPAIDARISINGEQYCFDTVFEVHARPVRSIQVDGTSIYWDAEPPADAHDVVWGSLRALRDSGGNFTVAVNGCLAHDVPGDAVALSPANPAPGDGFFFLLRDVEAGMPESFDSGAPSQAEPSDDLIGASPMTCP